jgi:hypothetical protein
MMLPVPTLLPLPAFLACSVCGEERARKAFSGGAAKETVGYGVVPFMRCNTDPLARIVWMHASTSEAI